MLHFRMGIICCLFTLNIQAQYVYMKQFTTSDGLPSNTVNDVLQDNGGFMWFATDHGVSRFDGHRFTNFTSQDGIADDEIIRLGKDHQGRIWFLGFNGKASFYLKGKFYYEKNSALVSQTQLNSVFTKFLISKTGTAYLISNTDGFLQVQGDQVKKFSSDTLLKRFGIRFVNGFKSVKLDVADNLWIFTADSAFIFRDGDMNLPERSKMPLSNQVFYAYFLSDGSRVIPAEGKLIRYHENKKDSITGLPLHPSLGYYSVEEDGNNNLWLLTSEGACFFRDKKLDYQHLVKVLDHKYAAHVFTDHEGNTWLLPWRDGVYMIPSLEVRFLNASNGLANNNVLVLADHPQGVISGFANGTVQLIRANGNSISPETAVSLGSYMLGILPNGKNNWLFLTNVEMIRADKDFKILEKKNITWAKSYLLRANGSLLIGGGFDLSELQDGKLSTRYHFTRENRIYSIAEDNYNMVWLGTEKGLYLFQDSAMQYFGDKFPLLKGRINDLKFDTNERLWIASSQNGLLMMEGNEIRSMLDFPEKISANKIFMDHTGSIYAGTNKGIFILGKKGNAIFSVKRISKSDGLVSEKINTLLVKEGMMWIGTDEGLQIFPFDKNLQKVSSIPIRLTTFTINGKSFSPDSTLSLNYQQNNIHLSFTGISFREPQSVIYRYKIQSGDTTWQYTFNSSLDLPELSPSNYRLLVQAGTSKSNWSSSPLLVSFTIHSPFWKTWWFYLIVVAGGASSGFLFFRYRYHMREKEEEQKRKSVEAELAALRSQMNPHFIFNSLNAIQDFIFQHKSDEANEYLVKFSKLIRLILTQSRKQVVSVEEEFELLRYYLQLEALRFDEKWVWNIYIAQEIDPAQTFIPSLLIQPVVENSINHGFKGLNKPGILTITLSQINSTLQCIIEDNGKGRNVSTEEKQDRSSLAMKIVEERIKALNQLHKQKISFLIEDLANESGVPTGTKTTFIFQQN